jgi:hypothetical protein
VLLAMYEVDKDGWHHATIIGHTKASTLFPFTMVEAALLQEWDVLLYHNSFAQMISQECLIDQKNTALTNRLQQYPWLRHKLHLLRGQLQNNNFLDKTSVAVTTLALLFIKDQNVSQKFKKLLKGIVQRD